MPVIVTPDKYDFEAIRDILQPYEAKLMLRYPVSMRLNNSQNDDAESAAAIKLNASTREPLF